jgi:hypothetical protein
MPRWCWFVLIPLIVMCCRDIHRSLLRDAESKARESGFKNGYEFARQSAVIKGFGVDTPDKRWHFTLSITPDIDEPKNTTVRFKFEPLTDEAREIEERLAAEEAKKGE